MTLESTFSKEQESPDENDFHSHILLEDKCTIMEDTTCYADGTVMSTGMSVQKLTVVTKDKSFKGHKHNHRMNFVCIVDINRRVIWKAPTEPMLKTNQQIFNKYQLLELFVESEVGIATDKCFTPNKNDNKVLINSVTP